MMLGGQCVMTSLMKLMQEQCVSVLGGLYNLVSCKAYCWHITYLFMCTYTESIIIPTTTPTNSNPIFLSQLDCHSDDEDLLQCNRVSDIPSLGLHSCTHSQDVSVRCTGEQTSSFCETILASLCCFMCRDERMC